MDRVVDVNPFLFPFFKYHHSFFQSAATKQDSNAHGMATTAVTTVMVMVTMVTVVVLNGNLVIRLAYQMTIMCFTPIHLHL